MTTILSILFAGSLHILEQRADTLPPTPDPIEAYADSLDARAAVLDSLADDLRAQAKILRMPTKGAPR